MGACSEGGGAYAPDRETLVVLNPQSGGYSPTYGKRAM
jgi:hypothetical protein